MRGGGESRTGLSQRDLGGGGVPFLCRGGGAIGTFWRSTGVFIRVLADGGGVPFLCRGGGGAGTILRGGVLFLFVPLICSGGGVGIEGDDGGTAAGGGSGCGFSGAGLTSLAENLCAVDSTVSCHLRWRIHIMHQAPIMHHILTHLENPYYASFNRIALLSTSCGDHHPHTLLPILPGRWGTPGALPEGKG